MDVSQIQAMVRAVATSHKGGVPIQIFQRDYQTLVGSPVPFRKFGYSDLESMLNSMTDVIRLKRIGGQTLIQEVVTRDTAHISKLVATQNSSKKSSKSLTTKFQAPRKLYSKTSLSRRPLKPLNRLEKQIRQPSPKTPDDLSITFFNQNAKLDYEVPPRFTKLARNTTVISRESKPAIVVPDNSVSSDLTPKPISPTSTGDDYKKQLNEYANSKKLVVSSYKTLPFKLKRGVSYYCCTIKVNGRQYSTYPEESKTREEAEQLAAKITLDNLISNDKSSKNVIHGINVQELICRIIEIIGDRTTGVFNIGIEKEYKEIYDVPIPPVWLKILEENCSRIKIEKVDEKRSIVYPKIAKKLRESTSPVNLTTSNDSSNDSGRPPSAASDLSTSSRSETMSPPPLVLPDDNSFPVFVTHINSPKNIVFRLVDYSSEYDDLANDMDMFYQDHQQPALSVEVNKVYAAKIDESWLRVGVLALHTANGKAQCIFLDVGEIEYIEPSRLHILNDQFKMLPYQALQCQLDGLDEIANNNNAFIHLISLVRGKTFFATIVNRDEPISVILYDTSTDTDINLNEKLLSVTKNTKIGPELPKVGGIKEVYLCHAEVDGSIYVNMESPYYTYLQDEISMVVEKAENDEGSVTSVKENKMYLAKYGEDDSWYRAVITNIDENMVNAEYIDFGNADKIPISSLRDLEVLSDTLTSLPAQGIECSLHGLPPDGYEWTENAIDKLVALAPSDQPLLLKVIEVGLSKKKPAVELFRRIEPNNELVSVNTTLLVSQDLFKKSKKVIIDMTSKTSCCRQNSSTPPLPSPCLLRTQSSLNDGIRVPCLEVPAPGELYDVNVTLAANPHNFTCQPYNQLTDLYNLMERMQEYYNSSENVVQWSCNHLKTGTFYAAKHKDDLWYRIYVKDIISHDTVIEVAAYLIDYGDYAILPDTKLQPLNENFTKLPYMAIKAKLHGIKPLHGDWTVEECIRFHKVVVNKQFVSHIKEKGLDTSSGLSVYHFSVSLIDTSGNEDIFIERVLVDEGVAIRLT